MKRDSPQENLRKAAVVLATLERKQAASILKSLDPEVVQTLIAEVQILGEIEPEERQAAFEEFAARLHRGINPRGGTEVARALLQEVVSDPAKRENIERESRRAFSSIVDVNEVDLANMLVHEQPSVAAMILSFLPPKKTATILAHMEDEPRGEIIGRLACGRNTDPDIVARIERIFVDKVVSVIHTTKGEKMDSLGGPKFVASVFQHLEQAVEEQLLKAIQEVSPERADEVRDLLFTFEDVVRLRDQDIQKVLRQVPLDKLVIALRGVPSEVREKMEHNLSRHAQESLAEEAQLLGKVKLADVEAEQRNIVTIIRGLEAGGEISLRPDEKEEVYV